MGDAIKLFVWPKRGSPLAAWAAFAADVDEARQYLWFREALAPEQAPLTEIEIDIAGEPECWDFPDTNNHLLAAQTTGIPIAPPLLSKLAPEPEPVISPPMLDDEPEYDISVLVGKTVVDLKNYDDEEVVFFTDDGVYLLYHKQDCCERVFLLDVVGDADMFIGDEITRAEVRSTENDLPAGGCGQETWTFYEFACPCQTMTMRWYGSSNGYYSERVYFKRLTDAEVAALKLRADTVWPSLR